jgi:DNA-binding MarR family transcriptional regulator
LAQPYGETQFKVLTAVYDHWSTYRFGPTVADLRDRVGLTGRSSVQWHIDSLVEQGFLLRTPKKHRSLRLTSKGKQLVELMRDVDGETESGRNTPEPRHSTSGV